MDETGENRMRREEERAVVLKNKRGKGESLVCSVLTTIHTKKLLFKYERARLLLLLGYY